MHTEVLWKSRILKVAKESNNGNNNNDTENRSNGYN